jgi:AcrR family transcriptional regulator
MPTPDRTSLAEIVETGRELLEQGGLDGLTMQAVADRVGVRAPSLYKRVRNRRELVALIADATVRELGDRLDAAAAGEPDARRALAALARAARSFARDRSRSGSCSPRAPISTSIPSRSRGRAPQ